jgi:hypothetical protein
VPCRSPPPECVKRISWIAARGLIPDAAPWVMRELAHVLARLAGVPVGSVGSSGRARQDRFRRRWAVPQRSVSD